MTNAKKTNDIYLGMKGFDYQFLPSRGLVFLAQTDGQTPKAAAEHSVFDRAIDTHGGILPDGSRTRFIALVAPWRGRPVEQLFTVTAA